MQYLIRYYMSEIKLDQLILPPPLAYTRTPLLETPSDLIGNVSTDASGALFKSYVEYRNFGSYIYEGYDYWLNEILPLQVREFQFTGSDGSIFGIEWHHYESPRTFPVADRSEPLLPQLARLTDTTYTVKSFVTYFRIYRDEKGVLQKRATEPEEFCRLPLCLGSQYCYLHNKTERELLALGECPNSAFGYFIIAGTEKTVINQDKLAVNKIITYYETKKNLNFVNSMITFYTYRGSKKIQVILGKFNQLELHLPFFGSVAGKFININVYSGFRLLGCTDIEVATTLILQFVAPNVRNRARKYLEISRVDLSGIPDDVLYIAKLKNIADSDNWRERIIDLFNSEMLPVVPNDPLQPGYSGMCKCIVLAQMCARILNYQCGTSKLDDRDNWANKRVETAAKAMESLMTKKMYYISEAGSNSYRSNIANQTSSVKTLDAFKSIMNSYVKSIEHDFEKSFNSDNWGAQGSEKKENITDILKRGSMADVYSQLTQVNAPTGAKGSSAARLVHPSQYGYICMIQSPDSDRAGLVKHLAVTAFPTVDQPDRYILEYISYTNWTGSGYVRSVDMGNLLRTLFVRDAAGAWTIATAPGYTQLCTINGIPRGWCDARVVYQYVRGLKLKGTFPYCGVHLRNEGVEIYTTGGRVTRPLLVVNPLTHNLVLHEVVVNGTKLDDPAFVAAQNRDNKYIQTLMQHGALEYVDADEQNEYAVIAQTESQITAYISQLGTLQASVNTLTAALRDSGNDPRIRVELDAATAALEKCRSGAYTHCELTQTSIMGVAASLGPLSNHSQGPRNTFQCSMTKQALTIYHNNYMTRFDTTAKVLAFPTRPIFETQIASLIGMDRAPNGQNVIVAVMTYAGGYTIEDSFIFNQGSIDRGLFASIKYVTIKEYESSGDESERFGIPKLVAKPGAADPMARYSHLHSNGFPVEGSRLEYGQIVVAKYKKRRGTNEYVDASQ